MAGSLISGLIARGYPANAVIASAPSDQTRRKLSDKFGIRTTASNNDAAEEADIIVLAVKPQIMKEVCLSLADGIGSDLLIISVAAGITTPLVDQWLGGNHAIVRCMPNTPSQLRCGASGLYANNRVSAVQRALCQQILESVGTVEWLDDESLMDAVTAIAGSGPAYYFLLMELMEKTGAELGLPPEMARSLTVQTALGAARMAAEDELSPAELRKRVTSKNGTTERAITLFLKEGLEDIIRKGVTGARDRGRELSQEFENQGSVKK